MHEDVVALRDDGVWKARSALSASYCLSQALAADGCATHGFNPVTGACSG
jgi:hypothetical protein